MLVVVGAETLVLALLAVLVAGLLRSHARILQALHSLGVDLESHPGATAPPATSTTPVPLRLPKLSMDRPAGGPAFNITGQTATGESVSTTADRPAARASRSAASASFGYRGSTPASIAVAPAARACSS